MTRDKFYQVVIESIQKHLGEGYLVSLSTSLKANDVKKVAVKIDNEDCSISPLIYMDDLFMQYERFEDMNEVLNYVSELLSKQRITGPYDFRLFMDYERVKENIFPRLINRNLNKEFLKDKIYREWLDLAVAYYFSFDLATNLGEFSINQAGEKIDGHITLIKEHLKMWGITEEELHEQALKNQRRVMQAKIQDLSDVLIQMILSNAKEEGIIESGYVTEEQLLFIARDQFAHSETGTFFILSAGRENHFGAVEMYASNVISEFAEETEANILILPSSTEEVLLVKEDESGISLDRFSEMVKEVNETQVEKQFWLGDTIYRFSRDHGEIEIAYQR